MDNKSGKIRRGIICLLFLIGGATGIRNVVIEVPPMVRSGDAALLTCNYDLEGENLYGIKWYREEEEFYRYVPKEAPAYRTFPVHSIGVDVSNSNEKDVTLVNVSRELTGRYKCEVSADSPSFHTVIKASRMVVVDVPDTDPTIVPEKQRLPAGETLRANCTSGASRPAPTITWTLNGDFLNNATMEYTVRSHVIHNATVGRNATRSSLEVKVTADLFRDGRLRLRCFAELPRVYKESAEQEVTEDVPLIGSITGDASPHSHQSNGGCGRVGLPGSPGPTILSLMGATAALMRALR